MPVPLRAARMSVLGRALAQHAPLAFPLTLEFPGDETHARAEQTFASRETLERTLTDAQVNAVMDGLAIYRLQDGGFILADRASHDPWRDQAHAAPRRPWLDIGRGWFRGFGRS